LKNRLPEVLAVVFIFLAAFGLIHQQLTSSDVWFHFGQMRNHETIVACCIVAAIALLIGKYLGRISS